VTRVRPWATGLIVAAGLCLLGWLILGLLVPAFGGPPPDELAHDFTGATVRLFVPFLALVFLVEAVLLLVRRPRRLGTSDRVALLLQASTLVLILVGVCVDAVVGIRAFTTPYWGAIAIWLATVALSLVAAVVLLVGTLTAARDRAAPAAP